MLKLPCEIMIWEFLPALRRELVKALLKDGVPRKEIASMLGITDSAISQYLKKKRGMHFRFDAAVTQRIQQIARNLRNTPAKNRSARLIAEICKFCLMLKRKKVLCPLCLKQNPELNKNCNVARRIK